MKFASSRLVLDRGGLATLFSSVESKMPLRFTRRKNEERKKRARKGATSLATALPAITSMDQSVSGSETNKKAKLDARLGNHTQDFNMGAFRSEPDSDCSLFPFHEFTTHRILFTDPRSKTICVLGSCAGFGAGERAIVVAEKQPLTESTLPHLFSPSLAEKKFQNDVYSQYLLDCKEGGLGEVRVTTVYPATDKHVQKYEAQKRRFVLETPASYEEITKPFAEKQSLSLDVCEDYARKVQNS